jgi:hypothetical protein
MMMSNFERIDDAFIDKDLFHAVGWDFVERNVRQNLGRRTTYKNKTIVFTVHDPWGMVWTDDGPMQKFLVLEIEWKRFHENKGSYYLPVITSRPIL